MDPDETLRRLREYAGEVLNAHADDLELTDARSNDLALAEAFTDLDEWLTKSGFAPAEWRRLTTPLGKGVTVTVTDSAGADGATVLMVDTTFEPSGSDGGPGLRVLINDDPAYVGKAYVPVTELAWAITNSDGDVLSRFATQQEARSALDTGEYATWDGTTITHATADVCPGIEAGGDCTCDDTTVFGGP